MSKRFQAEKWSGAIISHSLPELRQKLAQKQALTVSLSPEVINAFRAMGEDWQTRIDEALRDWLKTHALSR